MQALYKRFGEGSFTYASLPTVTNPPKAALPRKLDAATLTQHELDSAAMYDSANEHSIPGLLFLAHHLH